jgi:alpha-beta hydrolase superfamily lysophospholipase
LTTKKKKFILWGRSMGAVASLMYTFKDPQYVEYLILDSPFSSIETMVRDVASSYIKLGEFLAMLVFKFICGSIKERIGYDLMELNPINYCSRMNTPIIFFVGKDDNLVLPERVKQMHDAYSGHKHLIVTNGSHESFRQPLELEEIFNRIQTFYGKEKKITSPKKVRGEDPKFIRENPILQ